MGKKCFTLECFKEKYFTKYPDSRIKLLEFLPDEKIKIESEGIIRIVNRYYLYKGRKYIKNNYLLNNYNSILEKLEEYIKKNNLNIIVLEILEKGYFKYRDEFGDCITHIYKIYNKCNPKIHAAINKTTYFINQAKKIHFDKYNYDKVIYINSGTKVQIYCNKHKEYFYMTPGNHLSIKGCSKCGDESGGLKNAIHATGWSYSNWILQANKSKNFDSFKVYIIECWNEEEHFYKIGKTFKLVKNRFHSNTLPYNYKILKIIELKPKNVCELEQKLKLINKENKYLPKLKFNGRYECFKKLENYEEFLT